MDDVSNSEQNIDLYNNDDFTLEIVPQEPPLPPIHLQIKWAAENQIRKYYPEYKQLNILMEGNETEIAKMRTFIQAVRDWSNGPNPDLNVVTTIVPQP